MVTLSDEQYRELSLRAMRATDRAAELEMLLAHKEAELRVWQQCYRELAAATSPLARILDKCIAKAVVGKAEEKGDAG